MAYAHAQPGEHCHCQRPAERIIGTQPHCGDHFTNLIETCRMNARARITTPRNLTPDGFTAWANLLRHGVNIGLITETEAAQAWNTARDFAT